MILLTDNISFFLNRSNYYETEIISNENRPLNTLKNDKFSEFNSPVYSSFPVSPVKQRLGPITRGN
jgi:hypothetical protein